MSNKPINRQAMRQQTEISCKPMPHSVETEKAVIGALLVESNAIEDVVGILNPDIFYEESLGKIYAVIAKLYEENTRIDLVTVYKALCESGDLEKVGGALALSELSGNMASSSNIQEHSQYLHQLWLARSLAKAGMEITAKATDPSYDIDDTITLALKEVEAISDKTAYASRISDISSVTRDCIENYQNARSGLKTGKYKAYARGLQSWIR